MDGIELLAPRFSQRRRPNVHAGNRPASFWMHVEGTRPPSLDAVMIDVGGVLFDDTCWQLWFFHLLSHVGLRTRYEMFYRVWEYEFLHDVWRGRREYWQSLAEFLFACGVPRGRCDELLLVGRSRQRRMERNLRPFHHAGAGLTQLASSGTLLIAVSNSTVNSRQLQEKLSALRLGKLFSATYSSLDVGEITGSGEFYNRVCGDRQLSPKRVAIVSNKQDSLRGGEQFGLFTIGIGSEELTADARVARFECLPGWLPNEFGDRPRRLAG